jgi:sugar phosphate isomerase/epimerase
MDRAREAPYPASGVGFCIGTFGLPMAPDGLDVRDGVLAAAAAGFTSVGLFTGRVAAFGVDETVRLLADHGMTAPTIDAAMTWSAGPDAAARDAAEHLDLAAAVGGEVLQAVELSGELTSFAAAVEGFAVLCERAREYGIRVAIEFVPFTAIPDLATAWSIIEQSGADNGGICLDFLHWQRQPGGPAPDLLATIPGAHIFYVQVSTLSDYITQAMTARELPGDGVVDIPGVLDTLAANGAEPKFAFEVFSDDLRALGPEEMARRVRASVGRSFS